MEKKGADEGLVSHVIDEEGDDPEIVDPLNMALAPIDMGLNRAQIEILTGRTPPQFIRKRKGRGVDKLSYVPVGYVRNRMNMAFGLDWDWQILHKEIIEDQIITRGRLTVRISGRVIVKDGDGGANIQRYSEGPNVGKAIDIGDDFKSSSSDAFKVAARLLGIGADLAWLEEAELERHAEEQRQAEARQPRPTRYQEPSSPPPSPARSDNTDDLEMRRVTREIKDEMMALTSDVEVQRIISRELLDLMPDDRGVLPVDASSLNLHQRHLYLAGLKKMGASILEVIRKVQSQEGSEEKGDGE